MRKSQYNCYLTKAHLPFYWKIEKTILIKVCGILVLFIFSFEVFYGENNIFTIFFFSKVSFLLPYFPVLLVACS
ncbi:hypothetical protein RchiOBHm_Chr5g0080831 [Rosa chinensis]|uniref:Uncharacterized protein n=1 Tax=Rosa chinensis TaxID=74649 RepID=A0A2P6QMV2_ROSCH|nr:hypothetical protein RchiOBHm_Chr5g0080831 [Rosa chinensis]